MSVGATKTFKLFSPVKLDGLTLKNRIGVSPMVTWVSEDGYVNDFQLAHYGSFAIGGVGLIVVEATAVEARGRITPADLGIWKDDHVEGLKRLATLIKSQGAVPAIQLAHAGRKASTPVIWKGVRGETLTAKNGGWDIVAPSAVAYDDKSQVPKEATLEDIEVLQKAFETAAIRAVKAGFEVRVVCFYIIIFNTI